MKNKTKKLRHGFKLDLSAVCGTDTLRPEFACVWFENGFMYATDAHIAIKAKLDRFTDFTIEEIELLNGKFINAKRFKNIFKSELIKVNENGFLDVINDIQYNFTKLSIKAPNLERVFNDIQNERQLTIDTISLNPTLLNRLYGAMHIKGQYKSQIVMNIFNSVKPIVVTNSEYNKSELIGCVLPMLIKD